VVVAIERGAGDALARGVADIAVRARVGVAARDARRGRVDAAGRRIAAVGRAGIVVVAIDLLADAGRDRIGAATGGEAVVAERRTLATIVGRAGISVVARRPRGGGIVDAAADGVARVLGAGSVVVAVDRRAVAHALALGIADIQGRADAAVVAGGADSRLVSAAARGIARVERALIVVVAVGRRSPDAARRDIQAAARGAGRVLAMIARGARIAVIARCSRRRTRMGAAVGGVACV